MGPDGVVPDTEDPHAALAFVASSDDMSLFLFFDLHVRLPLDLHVGLSLGQLDGFSGEVVETKRAGTEAVTDEGRFLEAVELESAARWVYCAPVLCDINTTRKPYT